MAAILAPAVDELDSLPAGSAIEQMLADYQVMRDQIGGSFTVPHGTTVFMFAGC